MAFMAWLYGQNGRSLIFMVMPGPNSAEYHFKPYKADNYFYFDHIIFLVDAN